MRASFSGSIPSGLGGSAQEPAQVRGLGPGHPADVMPASGEEDRDRHPRRPRRPGHHRQPRALCRPRPAQPAPLTSATPPSARTKPGTPPPAGFQHPHRMTRAPALTAPEGVALQATEQPKRAPEYAAWARMGRSPEAGVICSPSGDGAGERGSDLLGGAQPDPRPGRPPGVLNPEQGAQTCKRSVHGRLRRSQILGRLPRPCLSAPDGRPPLPFRFQNRAPPQSAAYWGSRTLKPDHVSLARWWYQRARACGACAARTKRRCWLLSVDLPV